MIRHIDLNAGDNILIFQRGIKFARSFHGNNEDFFNEC